MTLYNLAQPRIPGVGDGRRRFDILTIGDWTALGDRYIDRVHVRQRVAFVGQRP
jgi:hypothetical protein